MAATRIDIISDGGTTRNSVRGTGLVNYDLSGGDAVFYINKSMMPYQIAYVQFYFSGVVGGTNGVVSIMRSSVNPINSGIDFDISAVEFGATTTIDLGDSYIDYGDDYFGASWIGFKFTANLVTAGLLNKVYVSFKSND
jgi:hypothetical protein